VIGQQHPESVVDRFAGDEPFGQSLADAGTNRRSGDRAEVFPADPFEDENTR